MVLQYQNSTFYVSEDCGRSQLSYGGIAVCHGAVLGLGQGTPLTRSLLSELASPRGDRQQANKIMQTGERAMKKSKD